MKITELKAGHVYGYSETNRPYSVSPWLLLSKDRYKVENGRAMVARTDVFERADQRTHLGMGHQYPYTTCGYPAVQLSFRHNDSDYDAKLARVIFLADYRNNTKNNSEIIDDGVVLGRYRLITNTRYLHGDYLQWVADDERADRQRAQIAQEHEAERQGNLARYRALEARLRALGLTGYAVCDYEEPTCFEGLRFEDMDTLLDLAEYGNERAIDG